MGSKKETRFGDPLSFVQNMARRHDVILRDSEGSQVEDWNGPMYESDNKTLKKNGVEHYLSIGIYLYDLRDKFPLDPRLAKMPRTIVDYAYGEREIKGQALEDFHIMKDDLGTFGRFRKNISLNIQYGVEDRSRIRNPGYLESTIIMNIANEGSGDHSIIGVGGLPELEGDSLGPNFLVPDFQDVIDYSTEDFRPWINRMFEHHTGVPKDEWHDPRMYDPHSEIEKIVDESVGALFSGDEREGIERRIQEARLNMRKGWVSIPRLNLGAIKLPTPGMKDIGRDTFVTNATPYLVEYLDALGVMSREEAESLAERRLVNYFIHDRGFQLSRERATEIVEQLNGSDSEETDFSADEKVV